MPDGLPIQVVTVPVTDVDQAAAFYSQQAGFVLDVDYQAAARIVDRCTPDRGVQRSAMLDPGQALP